MGVLKVIFIILEVVVLFNLIILVHELGHFLAARWRGLKVDRFGIWFGKALWQKEINGVVYCLGSIPAGGYVALPQMAPMEAIEGKNVQSNESLPPISPLDKIIVALAGPLFSFGLAIVFAFIVWGVGRPVNETETTTVVGYVMTNSPAEKAGIRPGDRILEVDGHPVRKFGGVGDTVSWRVVRSEGETIPLKLERDGAVIEVVAVPTRDATRGWQRKALRQIKVLPHQTPVVAKVTAGGPAAVAGLKPNDIIRRVNGNVLHHPLALPDAIAAKPQAPLNLEVERQGKTLQLVVTPQVPVGQEQARIGIEWDNSGQMSLTFPAPWEQIRASVNAMTSTFSALFSPKSDIGPQHLTGPVGIMRIYYLLFESEMGWRLALWFSVVLNVNLALLNLLPIPVLDGGHITLALLEAVRRKPINVRLLQTVQTACAVLIIGYMLYVTFYDIQDLPWNSSRDKNAPEMKFQPAPGTNAPR